MEFSHLISSLGVFDAGNKAPTFNFKLLEFGIVSRTGPGNENQDVWNTFFDFYKGQIGADRISSIEQLQEHLIRDRAHIIQDIAFREYMKLHAREYPEEANDIKLIKLRCSEKFETKPGYRDDRQPWEIGNAHDIEHAFKQIGTTHLGNGKIENTIFARPSIALNFAVTAVLKNILRRIHDTDRELMRKAFEIYDGSGLTTPFSMRFWHMIQVQGMVASNDDYKKQMFRHPDFFKSELLQIKLQTLLASNADPNALLLLVSQEYVKSKGWFDSKHFDELTQELSEPDFEAGINESRSKANPS